MLEPNPFGGWVADHIWEIMSGGIVTVMGFLGRRVVRKHDDEHASLNMRLAALEAEKPVTGQELDKKLADLSDSLADRFSERQSDMQKTLTVILERLMNGGR